MVKLSKIWMFFIVAAIIQMGLVLFNEMLLKDWVSQIIQYCTYLVLFTILSEDA